MPSLRQSQTQSIFEVLPSKQQIVLVWIKMGKVCIGWRKSSIQVSKQLPDFMDTSNDFWKIQSWLILLMILTITWTTLSNITGFYHWYNWLFGLFFEIFLSKDSSKRRIQVQVNLTKLMTLKMCSLICFWLVSRIFSKILQIIFLW